MELQTVGNTRPLYTVKAFCALHSWPTEGALRWMIFNASQNGLESSGAIVRGGGGKRGRVLMDAEKFWRWVRNGGGAS